MNVARLIEELQKMPAHARVRFFVDSPIPPELHPDGVGRWKGDKDGEVGAVVYEGSYVLLRE